MFEIPAEVLHIMKELNKNQYQSYLVGGCVRDFLLNKTPHDYDICTSATPEQVKNVFTKTIPTGEKHGTITVLINKCPIEVTTFMKSTIYKGDVRENVFTDNLEEDLARRDFTINAMALDSEGVLHDYHNGKRDLRDRVIRTVGYPEDRYREDPLRMMRAVRFATLLKAKYEPSTWYEIMDNLELMEGVSVERIRDEFVKILISEQVETGLRDLELAGLLDIVVPEVKPMYNFDQHNKHHHLNAFEHTIEVVKNTSPELNVRLAGFFHDIGKPLSVSEDKDKKEYHFYSHHTIGADMTKKILTRMKFDNNTVENVTVLVREHMSRMNLLNDKGVKKLINRVGVHNLDDLFDLQIADIKGSKPPHDFSYVENIKRRAEEIIDTNQPLSIKDLEIGGKELLEIGMKPGKQMGSTLQELLDEVLENPELNKKQTLLTMVKEKAEQRKIGI